MYNVQRLYMQKSELQLVEYYIQVMVFTIFRRLFE